MRFCFLTPPVVQEVGLKEKMCWLRVCEHKSTSATPFTPGIKSHLGDLITSGQV